jgi:serine phosphatase RsbU (regulator of sigma subunit)
LALAAPVGGALGCPGMQVVTSWEGPLSRLLDAAEDASPVQAVEAVTDALSEALGAEAVFFLITDVSGRGLVRLSHVHQGEGAGEPKGSGIRLRGEAVSRIDDEERGVELPFDGGPAEEALRTQTVQVVPPGVAHHRGGEPGTWLILAPVTERGEVLGLLQLSVRKEPDAEALSQIARIGHVLAFVVIANRRHTDLFEWGQRSTLFSLSAEIQRRLLPAAFTCEAGAFTLSAWLEPAASVGGDTFDYSLARDTLHLSVTDAMGHGVASALTATLCVGSLRNTRRAGGSLVEQATAANLALHERATSTGTEGFATGLLGRLDLRTGTLALINAGHVPLYLWRAGRVTPIALPVELPLGLFQDTVYSSTDLVLEPGDRLVLVTDGMLERNAATLDLVAEISSSRALHPREATRRLTDKVLRTSGWSLSDDATMLVLDWYGGHGTDRATVAGADPRRASPAALSPPQKGW